MLSEFDCPACASRNWRGLEVHRYRRGERAATPGGPLNDYELLRRRVLFEVWFPGEQEVVLRARVCESCGLVAYAPRPSATDLDAKYEFLGRFEQTGGSSSSEAGALMDYERAERTRGAAVSALGHGPSRVLDFGGGDGKLLAPFLERGAECAVIDHNPEPLPGVTRLGTTLGDVQADGSYDAIIASHVLEHLADPASALRALRALLAPRGVIVSEVPLEVWKGAPIARDPVTHVNFFTTGTLAELHERSGWRVVDARALRGNYAEARKEVVVVVAHAGGDAPSIAGSGAAEAERLLDPGFGAELARAWRLRRIPSARGVARRLGLVRASAPRPPPAMRPEPYEPRRYWSDRLEGEFSLRGTGHLSYSVGYNRWLYRAKRRALKRALAGTPSGRALDVGSGTGWVVRELLRRGESVEGCDIAPAVIERLRTELPEAPFMQVELGTEPVPRGDGTYDLVTALDVLYHVTDDQAWGAAVAELARVTRSGGAVVVSDGFGDSDRAPAPHVHLRSLQRWRELAAGSGLRLERTVPLYRWLSRDRETGLFRHLPGSLRGPAEYALELAAPREPHMSIAVLVRQG